MKYLLILAVLLTGCATRHFTDSIICGEITTKDVHVSKRDREVYTLTRPDGLKATAGKQACVVLYGK